MKHRQMRDLAAQMTFEEDVQISEFLESSPREGTQILARQTGLAVEMLHCSVAEKFTSPQDEATPDFLALVRRAVDASVPASAPKRTLKSMAADSGVSFAEIAKTLDVSLAVVTLLNLRNVEISTVPARFLAALAECVSETVDNVRAALSGPPVLSSQVMYLAPSQPTVGQKVDFREELESDPDVSEAGRARWIVPEGKSE